MQLTLLVIPPVLLLEGIRVALVVIDGTHPSVNGQNFSKPSERTEHVSAIETIANAFNVPVYESLKSFVLNYR